ncbi:MAG: hypothetical protein Fur0010_09110 [Bdellovibrio sp.]
MKYAIVDVETTGTRAKTGKIIELAIILHDGEKVEDCFSTLIDPERSIPPYITKLTGISREMVNIAPPFYQVAKKIVELTKGRVFVAHNVGFDYEFLRKEFEELGYSFVRKKLCTVRLSRKLFPGLKSYSLANLCQHFNLSNSRPHRAFEDALVTSELFNLLIKQSRTLGFENLIQAESRQYSMPPKLNLEDIEYLPEAPGVYLMKNERKEHIYIGKSLNIKKRVIEHLRDRQGSNKDYSFKVQLAMIDYIETGSEAIALLLENELIKKYRPPFNFTRRRTNFKWGLFHRPESLEPLVIREVQEGDTPLLFFSSKKSAFSKLDEIQTWVLDGRDLLTHPSLCFPKGRFILIDQGRTSNECSFILVEDQQVKGFGYSDRLDINMFSSDSFQELEFYGLSLFPDMNTLLLPFIHKLKRVKLPKMSHLDQDF